MSETPGQEPLTHKQKQENRIVDRVIPLVIARMGQQAPPANEMSEKDFGKFVRFMESVRLMAASAILPIQVLEIGFSITQHAQF